jgi:phosphomethylpyrimidine synthase
MHLAWQGVITEEMQYFGERDELKAELIRSEVARGHCIIPANIQCEG